MRVPLVSTSITTTSPATFAEAVGRVQRWWSDDPTQWLTFGTILAMSQRILAEVSSPLDDPSGDPA